MFRIQTVQGQFIADVDQPYYVKRSKESESWIQAQSASDAEAVVVDQLYNIAGLPTADPDCPTVEILITAQGSMSVPEDIIHVTEGFGML